MDKFREDAYALSLPVLPTIEPVEVHASTGGAASSSGLPIGPGRIGNIIAADGEPVVAQLRTRAARTWFEQSLSSIAGCVIALGDSESE